MRNTRGFSTGFSMGARLAQAALERKLRDELERRRLKQQAQQAALDRALRLQQLATDLGTRQQGLQLQRRGQDLANKRFYAGLEADKSADERRLALQRQLAQQRAAQEQQAAMATASQRLAELRKEAEKIHAAGEAWRDPKVAVKRIAPETGDELTFEVPLSRYRTMVRQETAPEPTVIPPNTIQTPHRGARIRQNGRVFEFLGGDPKDPKNYKLVQQ